jgi:hypothetical protein
VVAAADAEVALTALRAGGEEAHLVGRLEPGEGVALDGALFA